MTNQAIALSAAELAELASCETVIEHGLKVFQAVGLALLTIREKRLYRAKFNSFEQYCQYQWGFSDEHARRLMRGAEVVENLAGTPPIGGVLPGNEAQVRPLLSLTPDQQREAWQRAVETAPGGKVTAAHVEQVAQPYKPVTGRRSGVNFAGEGVEPDLDENGQPLVRRDSLTPLDVPPGTWVRWHGKRFVVKGYNGGSGNLWLMDERGKRSWVPLREVTRIDDEATEERIAEQDDDEEDDELRAGDVVRYGGQLFTLQGVASSGRVYFDVPKSHKLHGRGIESEDVLLIERKETPPPTPAPHRIQGGEKTPSALVAGDKVITRTGHEGVIVVADVGRHVVVETVNGRTIHERSTLTKVAPVTTAPPLAEEIVQIDNVPVAETHPAGFKIFYGGSGWATCVNCGESHPRWSPVRGGDWRCDKPNCKRLTHDDLMIEYTKADADAEQRQERRESAQRSAFRSAGQTPRQNGQAVHYSSESPEWYTPPEIAALVREVMPINLDPASCYAAQQVIHADAYFDAQMNGLHPMRRWDGRVFLNPPYGREIGKWVERLISEYKAAHTIEAILLTPARPDTEWFGLLRDYPRCFVTGRLKFWTGETPDDQQEAAPFPSALFYLGNRFARFAEAFSTIGDIYTLWRPQS